MEAIATGIKKKMSRMSRNKDAQWPPCSNERLINLQLVQTERKEGFGAHQLKDEKKKRTPISYTDIFKNDEDIVVDHVIVEGNAGIGKTTLCTIFNKGWAENKMFQDFECIFLLPLRDTKVSSAKRLEEIVQLFHISEDICASAVKELKTNQGEPVLIIADGWDELDAYNRSEESFLYKLLVLGKILPLASVLITSRSSASAPLHHYQYRFIEIVGFDEENIQQYIESEFKEYPEKASTLINQLKSNTLLQSICSVPLNCALICHMWHTLDQALPNSMTKLYSLLVRCFILRNLKKRIQDYSSINSINSFDDLREDLQKIFSHTCHFAYECLLRDTIVFSQQEVAKQFPEVSIQNPRDEILCFGLLQSAESLLPNGQGLSFHFAHLTVQEFLAAFHVATQSRKSRLSICNIHAKNERFEVMWQFVFGLCSSDGSYSSIIKPVTEDFLDSFFLRAKDEQLLLCHCAGELNNKTFSAKVASKLDGDLSVGADNLLDCNAVFHILRHSSPCFDVSIDLSGCGMSDRQLKELTDILSKAGSKLKVTSLDLDDNKLTGKGMTDLFNRASASLSSLKDIDIDTNKITVLSISPNIESLSASNNPLGIVGMQSLKRFVKAGMLVKLNSLILENVFVEDFTEVGTNMCEILSSIGQHCPSLKHLNLSKNRFDENGAFALGKALPYLCTGRSRFNLNLNESNLDCTLAVSFSHGLVYTLTSKLYTPSTESLSKCSLSLTDNLIGHSGLLALFRTLGTKHCFITDIDCDDTKLSCTEQDVLATAVKDFVPSIELQITHSTLRYLYLSNTRSTKGTYIKSLEIAVREGLLCNLEDLYLSKALTDDPHENGALLMALLPPMAVHCFKLESLDISSNQLDTTAAKVLGYAFVKFTTDKKKFELDLSETGLNSVSVTAFCKSVMKTPLHSRLYIKIEVDDINIDFSQNPVGYDGLSAIFHMLNSKNCLVTQLTLDDIAEIDSLDRSVKKIQVDEKAITSGTSQLKKLSLDGNKTFEEGLHIECLEKGAKEGAFVLLQELNLSNTLSDSAELNGILLSKLLPSITSGCVCLIELNLSDNMLNSQTGTKALGQALPYLCNARKDFTLNLSDCHLDTDSITAFSDSAIATLPSITQSQLSTQNISLDLSCNPFQCEGLLRILDMLRCKNCPITSLNLSETISGGLFDPNSCNLQVDCVNTNLKELDLDENKFGGSKVFLLIKYLQVCRSLETLSCWECSLSNHDIITVLQHLKNLDIRLQKFRKWDLRECIIDDEGAYALLECSPDLFPNLETVNLDNNLVHDDMQSKLKQKLKENTHQNKRSMKKKWKREKILGEWVKTQSPPRSEEMLAEFFQMWDELLNILVENILEQQSDDEIDFTDWDIELSSNESESEETKYGYCDFDLPPNEYDFDTTQGSVQAQKTKRYDASPSTQSTSPEKNIPDISLLLLEKELKTLTSVKLFGVYLSIPLHTIDKIIEKHSNDVKEQKLALFDFISRNSISFGITWASISNALSNLGYGHLAISIREKYCPQQKNKHNN